MGFSNRFDTSDKQEFVHNYTPLPFEAISALGEKANKNFAEGKQAEAELGALGQAVKAAPMYQEHRNTFVNGVNAKLKTLVDEAKGDYGSVDFKNKVAQLTTDFKNAPEVQAFANTKEFFDKNYQARKNKDGSERDLDYTFTKDKEGNFIQRDAVKDGVYNSKFTNYADYTEAAKKVMGDIKDSGFKTQSGLDFTNIVVNNGETQVLDTKTNKFVGVTDPRVRQLSTQLAGNYAQTDAGKHHLQTLLGADVDYNQISQAAASGDEKSIKLKQDVDNVFANHIYKSNANQIGGVSEQISDYHFVQDRARVAANDATKKALERVPLDVVNYAQGLPADLNKANPYKDLFSFDEKGNVKLSENNNSIVPAGSKTSGDNTAKMSGWINLDPNAPTEGVNAPMVTKKVLAANDYLNSTGQLADFKAKYTTGGKLDVVAMTNATLHEMAQGVKSGTYHNQAVPIFSEETNKALTNRLLPVYDGSGNVTSPGLIGNMTIVDDFGKAVPYSEKDKMEVFKGSKVTGGSFIDGDVIKVTKADGSTSNVKLNMPILKEKNKAVTDFIQNTNKQVITPPTVIEQQKKTNSLTRQYNDAIHNVEVSTSSPEIKTHKIETFKKIVGTIGELSKQGFVQSSKFNMSNGDTAYSFINYSVTGHPTQCMVVHSNGKINFANISTIGAEEFQHTYSTSIENASPNSETMNKFTTIVQ